MAAEARIVIEVLGAGESVGRLDQIKAAEKRLNAQLQAGRISADQFSRSTNSLRAAQRLLEGGLNTSSAAIRNGVASTRTFATEQQRANQAAQLLARTTGVVMPQAMNKILAQSRLIGPALSAAFSVAVIGGFAVVLASLIPRIQKSIAALAGFGETAKKVLDDVKKSNLELLTSFATVATGLISLRVIQEQYVAEQIRARVAAENQATAFELLTKQFSGLSLLTIPFAIAALIKYGGDVDKATDATSTWGKALEDATKLLEELRKKSNAVTVQVVRLADAMGAFISLSDKRPTLLRAEELEAIAQFERMLRAITVLRETSAKSPGQKQLNKELDEEARILDLILDRNEELRRQNEELVLGQLSGIERIIAERDRELAKIQEIRQAHQDNAVIIEQLANEEVLIRQQADIKIAEENKRRFEDMARQAESFFDRVLFSGRSFGSTMKDIFEEMKRFFIRQLLVMLVRWILTIKVMREFFDKVLGKLKIGGGGGGTNIGINVGIGVGGTAPTFPGDSFTAFAGGGLVAHAQRAMRTIQSVDGRLLAMLHQGEAVLNPGAVRLMGAGRIEALNARGRGPSASLGTPSFQSGGFVGTPAAGGQAVNVTVNVFPAPGMSAEQVANFTIRKLKRELRDQGLRLPI